VSSAAITVERLGKRYHLGAAQGRSQSFRELLTRAALAPIRRLRGRRLPSPTAEEFWALKDVSFEVPTGEVVGIIGRNGAGKSTLLKILSQIVEPTEGQAVLRGRVASLLEVGTGFHPELSGRENVFLNGSILGMSRREIESKFDAIVAFAEVERFLDTPVKHYSSGMYVRLAFAVAAHLDPEILIVDEVLAVGDAEFQKKCLGKMKELAQGGRGRTVLFVSHNLPAVRSLCTAGVLLVGGKVAAAGSTEDVVQRYLSLGSDSDVRSLVSSRPPGAAVWIRRAAVEADGAGDRPIRMGDRINLRVWFGASPAMRRPRLGWVLTDAQGTRLLGANNRYQSSEPLPTPVGNGTITCHLGLVPLMPGRYSISLYLGAEAQDDHILLDALTFEVFAHDVWGEGKIPPLGASALWWPSEFQIQPEPDG
jgi:lipopolysaccharide transport system ATP-binding protein